MKRTLEILLCLLLVLMALAACSSSEEESSVYSEISSAVSEVSPSPTPEQPELIGLVQFGDDETESAEREAFISRLEEWGCDEDELEMDYRNAGSSSAQAESICKDFVENGARLIVVFSPEAAQAALNASNGTDTAILYVGLKTAEIISGENVNGVSDNVSLSGTVELMMQSDEELKTVGIVYDAGDSTAAAQAEAFRSLCEAQGLAVTDKTVSTADEAAEAVNSLSGTAQAVFAPSGGAVSEGISQMSAAAVELELPLYSDSACMVQSGALAAVCADCEAMGRDAADMTVDLLSGDAVRDQSVSDGETYINQSTLDAMDVDIPDETENAAFFYAGSSAATEG